MSILTRYLLRQNLGLLLLICGIGLGVYVFVELFDMLDDFLEAGVSAGTIISYFVFRMPYILAQIFPAVFLIALMVQLGLMLRNRELLALQASAVSMGAVTRSIMLYAVALCLAQLVFSQFLGVAGHKAAERIRVEQVRNRKMMDRVLPNVWFREENFIVHMEKVKPQEQTGSGLVVNVLDPENSGRITEIIQAESFAAGQHGWILSGVVRVYPDSFTTVNASQATLPLVTSLVNFRTVDPKASLQSLPVWQLGEEIRRLKDSGSNIERLETAWHSKLSYAASILVMALLALAVISLFRTLYLIIPAGLVLTFAYYAIYVVFVSAGEKGLLPPGVGAWAANVLFAVFAGGVLFVARPSYR